MDIEAHLSEFYAPIPDDPNLPPAFAKISPIQRAWVMAFLDAGDENATAAARRAGYGKTSKDPANAVKQAGYRNSHDPDILEAMKELAKEKFRISGYKATTALMQLLDDPTHKDHFKAIERVLAQNGMIAALQIEHNHKIVMTEDEQIKKLMDLAHRLGMDPKTLLGSAGVVLDAEFEVIDTRQKVLTAPVEDDMWTVEPEE